MQHPDPIPQNVTIEEPEASIAPEPRPRKPRGFATMDRARVIEIARKGGRAAHTAGTAHEFTTEEAREAGRKGGKAMHENKKRRREAPAPQ